MTIKTQLSAAVLSALLLFPCAAAETSLRVDALTVVPSSPAQWRLDGVVLAPGYKGRPDFVLGRTGGSAEGDCDLSMDFDGVPEDASGRWRAEALPGYRRLGAGAAFKGSGAGGFEGRGTGLLLHPVRSELFGAGLRPADFTIEFRVNPVLAANGETLFAWKGAVLLPAGPFAQRIACVVEKGRIAWTFDNFFQPAGPDARPTRIALVAKSLLVPRTWTHQLVRYDSSTGLVELVVNGVPEAIAYATASGHEEPGPFRPRTGSSSSVELAPDFSGAVDELLFRTGFAERTDLSRYGRDPGLAVSPVVDLGTKNARLRRVDADYRAPGGSDVEFAYRCSDDPSGWRENAPAWIPFAPGAAFPAGVAGRYVQFRVELFPDGTGQAGPAFSGLTVRYVPDLPPPPPSELLARAIDGGVALAWSKVNDPGLGGYLVYYGDAPGSYSGVDAALGPSPIDVGKLQSATISGLANGKRYYFAVVAYDAAPSGQEGEFSKEASARPSLAPTGAGR